MKDWHGISLLNASYNVYRLFWKIYDSKEGGEGGNGR